MADATIEHGDMAEILQQVHLLQISHHADFGLQN